MTKDLPLVDGNEFVGPCLFGNTSFWTRGKGGGGNGFPLTSGSSSVFWSSLFLDGVKQSKVTAQGSRLSSDLHLFDCKLGTTDGLGGLIMVGAKREAANTSYYGGVKFAEFMFFRYHIPDGQRMKIAAALGVKWLGADNYKLEQVFDSVSVSAGASATFPYADVMATNLTVSGTVSARTVTAKNLSVTDGEIVAPLTIVDGGTISVVESDGVVPCLTAQAVLFAGKGTIILSAPSIGDPIVEPIKIITATDGPATPQKVNGWKTATGVRGVLVRRADGYYVEQAPGLVMIVR